MRIVIISFVEGSGGRTSATFFSALHHLRHVKPFVLSLIAVGILLASCSKAAGPAGNGPGAVVLHLNIEKDEVLLNHSYDQQSVYLTGSVLMDYVYLVTVRVALSVSTDLGWAASIVPEDMTFVSSATQFFNATVKVPAGTYNRSAILTVRGNATVSPGIPGDTGSDTALINVLGDSSGGNGTGPPAIPRGRPAPTGVFVPPVRLILGAATMGAIAFTALMLWYRKSVQTWRPARKRSKNDK